MLAPGNEVARKKAAYHNYGRHQKAQIEFKKLAIVSITECFTNGSCFENISDDEMALIKQPHYRP